MTNNNNKIKKKQISNLNITKKTQKFEITDVSSSSVEFYSENELNLVDGSSNSNSSEKSKQSFDNESDTNSKTKLSNANGESSEKTLDNIVLKTEKKRKKKTKQDKQFKQFNLAITIVRTSILKFSKKIRKPQIRISIYDESGKIFLNNSNKKEDIRTLPNDSYFISDHGFIDDPTSFLFSWKQENSLFIINENILNEKLIIFYELFDNTKKIEKIYQIAWCYYKPNSEKILTFKNENISLQLYCYNKSPKSTDTIYDEFMKRKLKEYPGYLLLNVDCQLTKINSDKTTENNNENFRKDSLKDKIINTLEQKNGNLDWNHIFRLNQSSSFKLPDKVIYKSSLFQSCKGSSSCAFNVNYDLLAFSVSSQKESVDIVILDLLNMKSNILKGHNSFIHYIEWCSTKLNEAGQTLLSCSEDKTCIIWSILENTYKIKHVLFHPSFVYTATFIIESFINLGSIVTGGRDNILRIWKIDEDSLTLNQELHEHNDFIIGIVYSYKSNKIYSADRTGNVIEWKFNNSELKWTLRKSTKHNSTLKQIVLHSSLNKIYILLHNFILTQDIRTGTVHEILNFYSLNDLPSGIAISKCGEFLFIGFKTKVICWNYRLKTTIKEFLFPKGNVFSIAFPKEKNMLAVSLLHDVIGECILYSTQDYMNVENVAKNYLQSKDLVRFSNPINKNFNNILNKLDDIFDLTNKEIKHTQSSEKNVASTQKKLKNNLKEEKAEKSNNTSSKESNFNNKTFSIEPSKKTFTFTKRTGTFNVVTVKETESLKIITNTFTVDKNNAKNYVDATDISESFGS